MTATWILSKAKNVFFLSEVLWRVTSIQVSLRLQPITGNTEIRYVLVKILHPLCLEISSMPSSTMKIKRIIFPFPINSSKRSSVKNKGGGDDLCSQRCKACWLHHEELNVKSELHPFAHRSWYTRISWIVSAHDLNKASPVWNPGPGI